MKTLSVLLMYAFGILGIQSIQGCTYETVDEYQAEQAAVSADGGMPGDVASDGGDVYKDKGASRTKQLTRGNYSPSQVMSENFTEVSDAQTPVAAVYTVQFAVIATPTPAGYVGPLQPSTITYADVVWSIGGNQIKRTISVSNGASITGVGEGCVVTVYDATGKAPAPIPPLARATDPVPNYTVIVTLAPGSRGDAALPPVYYPIPSFGVIAEGSDVTIPIPPNSGITSVNVTAYPARFGTAEEAPTCVVVQSTGFAGVKTYDVLTYQGFISLDPSATSVVINNATATLGVTYSVVFGVDG
jgi:hypothetical protein